MNIVRFLYELLRDLIGTNL